MLVGITYVDKKLQEEIEPGDSRTLSVLRDVLFPNVSILKV